MGSLERFEMFSHIFFNYSTIFSSENENELVEICFIKTTYFSINGGKGGIKREGGLINIFI